ncbi:hypothetical protein Pelo_19469 [Pelomyxa schiedti]|nr:hypothetical protein Pelo_19469 [Pelomyxa schiedti]
MCVHCSDKHKGLYTLSLLNEDMIPEHITIGHRWPHEIGYWATSPEGSLVYYFGTHGQGCGWYTLAGNQEEPSHYFTTMADLMSSYHNYYLDNNIPPPTSTPSTNMDVESDDL